MQRSTIRTMHTTADSQTSSQAILDFLAARSVVRSTDLTALGIARTALQRMEKQGKIVRLGRGLYALATADLGERASLAAVARRVPNGVLCLLSALRFHDMTTENPFEIWLAIDRNARSPVIAGLPLRVVRCNTATLGQGVEEHQVVGVTARVTTPARTVADCFKFRSKVGLDVAIAALRDYRHDRKGSQDELWQAAVVDRVARVMRPYMEAVL